VLPGRQLAESVAELAEWDVLRAIDMSRIPFIVLAHIEEVEFGASLAKVLRRHGSILPRLEDLWRRAKRASA
jgi:hypothetical protein